jgi:hypothetical protein
MTTKIVLGIALAWMAAASFLFAMSSPSSSPGLQNLRLILDPQIPQVRRRI